MTINPDSSHSHIFRVGYWIVGDDLYSPHIEIDMPEPLAPITMDWPMLVFSTTDLVMEFSMKVLENLTNVVGGTLYEVNFN